MKPILKSPDANALKAEIDIEAEKLRGSILTLSTPAEADAFRVNGLVGEYATLARFAGRIASLARFADRQPLKDYLAAETALLMQLLARQVDSIPPILPGQRIHDGGNSRSGIALLVDRPHNAVIFVCDASERGYTELEYANYSDCTASREEPALAAPQFWKLVDRYMPLTAVKAATKAARKGAR